MSTNAYISYTLKDNTIKSVYVHYDGDINHLGVMLNEYYLDLSDVKDLIKSSIDHIDDGEVLYMDNINELTEDDYEYHIYHDKDEFIDDMNPWAYYYLFENDVWYVSKPDEKSFTELDQAIEEEN